MKIVKFDLELKDLITILANALYGSHWASAERIETVKYTKEEIENEYGKFTVLDHMCFEDTLAVDLMKGHEILIADHTDEDGYVLTRVSLKDFKKALRKTMKEYPVVFNRFLQSGYFDALDADLVLQLAVFGEETYG